MEISIQEMEFLGLKLFPSYYVDPATIQTSVSNITNYQVSEPAKYSPTDYVKQLEDKIKSLENQLEHREGEIAILNGDIQKLEEELDTLKSPTTAPKVQQVQTQVNAPQTQQQAPETPKIATITPVTVKPLNIVKSEHVHAEPVQVEVKPATEPVTIDSTATIVKTNNKVLQYAAPLQDENGVVNNPSIILFIERDENSPGFYGNRFTLDLSNPEQANRFIRMFPSYIHSPDGSGIAKLVGCTFDPTIE